MTDDSIDWDALEASFQPPVPVFAVSTLNDMELVDRYDAVVSELLTRREAMSPKTDIGRDLHSMRGACLVELRRRGLR